MPGPKPSGMAKSAAARKAAQRARERQAKFDLTKLDDWDEKTCMAYLKAHPEQSSGLVWVRLGVIRSYVTVSWSHGLMKEVKYQLRRNTVSHDQSQNPSKRVLPTRRLPTA